MALDEFDAKKHSSVISYFIINYVLTNIIDKEIGKTIIKAERVKNDIDFKDYYSATKESTETQINRAETFIPHLEKFIIQKQNELK